MPTTGYWRRDKTRPSYLVRKRPRSKIYLLHTSATASIDEFRDQDTHLQRLPQASRIRDYWQDLRKVIYLMILCPYGL